MKLIQKAFQHLQKFSDNETKKWIPHFNSKIRLPNKKCLKHGMLIKLETDMSL